MARTVRATLKSGKFLDQSTKTKGRLKVVFSVKEDFNNWSPLIDFWVTSHENHYGKMKIFLIVMNSRQRAQPLKPLNLLLTHLNLFS